MVVQSERHYCLFTFGSVWKQFYKYHYIILHCWSFGTTHSVLLAYCITIFRVWFNSLMNYFPQRKITRLDVWRSARLLHRTTTPIPFWKDIISKFVPSYSITQRWTTFLPEKLCSTLFTMTVTFYFPYYHFTQQ